MKTIQNYLSDAQLRLNAIHKRMCQILTEQKANGKKFISDQEIDELIKKVMDSPPTKAEELNLFLQDTFEAYEISNTINHLGLFTLSNIQTHEIHFDQQNRKYPHRQFIETIFLIDHNKYLLSNHNIILIKLC